MERVTNAAGPQKKTQDNVEKDEKLDDSKKSLVEVRNSLSNLFLIITFETIKKALPSFDCFKKGWLENNSFVFLFRVSCSYSYIVKN